ncbi:MAG TPA: hypothetical protein VM287_06475 [Egibacteraceae bacterium]|nr:hypothetical protein [Egibacteraceae bacterium]
MISVAAVPARYPRLAADEHAVAEGCSKEHLGGNADLNRRARQVTPQGRADRNHAHAFRVLHHDQPVDAFAALGHDIDC